jgi:uncharacterized membrane protein
LKRVNLISYILGTFVFLMFAISILAPYFQSRSLTGISSFLYSFLELHCHQLPERSLWIFGAPMGLCSRCVAIYLSFSIVTLIIANKNDLTIYWKVGLLLLLPIIFDGLTQMLGIRMSSNTIRIITGVLGGIGLALVLKSIILISAKHLIDFCSEMKNLKNWRLFLSALILVFIFSTFLFKNNPPVYSQTGQKIILEQYTPVFLALRESVSTKNKKPGDIVQMAVVEDVIAQKKVLIKAGTSVVGKVSVSKEPGRLGESGEIAIVPRFVEAIDGQKIRLGGTLYARGKDKEVSTGVLTAICFPFALRRGGTASVIDGAELKAYVERSYEIEINTGASVSTSSND